MINLNEINGRNFWCRLVQPSWFCTYGARVRGIRRNRTNLHQPAPRQTKLELRRACLRLQAGSPTHLRRFSLSLVPVLGTRTIDRRHGQSPGLMLFG